MGVAIARTRSNVRSDRRRSCDLRYLCCGLHLLSRQESDRPHAEGCSCSTDLLHYLFAFEQCDDSPRCACTSPRKYRILQSLVVWDDCAGGRLSLRYGARMASADLSGGIDNQHQLVRNNLLLTGGTARVARDCWSDLPFHGYGLCIVWRHSTTAHLSDRCVVSLLALRGCRLDCGV